MIEALFVILGPIILLCVVGYLVMPYKTYTPEKWKELPDLRVAHLSHRARVDALYDIKMKRLSRERMERRIEEDERAKEYAQFLHETYLAKRAEAWKNGTPDVPTEKMPQMRYSARPNPMPTVPLDYKPGRYPYYSGMAKKRRLEGL